MSFVVSRIIVEIVIIMNQNKIRIIIATVAG